MELEILKFHLCPTSNHLVNHQQGMGAHFRRPALEMRGARGVYPWGGWRDVCTVRRRVSPCPRGRSILVRALPSARAESPFVKSGGGSAWLIGWSRAQSAQMYMCPNEGAQLGLTSSLGGWFFLRALCSSGVRGRPTAHCGLADRGCLPLLPQGTSARFHGNRTVRCFSRKHLNLICGELGCVSMMCFSHRTGMRRGKGEFAENLQFSWTSRELIISGGCWKSWRLSQIKGWCCHCI